MKRNSKKISVRRLFAWIMVVPFMLVASMQSGCARHNEEYSYTVNVLISGENEEIFEETLLSVTPGEDIVIEIPETEEFTFEKCDYPDYRIERKNNRTFLRLKRIRFDTRIRIYHTHHHHYTPQTNLIRYHANGGTLIAKNNNGIYFEQPITKRTHLRINTAIGVDKLKYDGYTFIGWNTASDGSGEHIGGGSRVSVNEGDCLDLYAQWVKWTDDTLFTYRLNEDTEDENDVILTSYTGETDVKTLVIPSQIDGKTVTALDTGFTQNWENAQTLILPQTLITVKQKAFNNCNFEEIYFFDNLMDVSDNSFRFLPKTVHINAVQAPAYPNTGDASQFAEKMDRLIVNKDKQKLVLFAGCSMSYGVNSPKIQEVYPDYVVCNMGLIGGMTAEFQMECMSKYLDDGDVLVHAPEQMSEYQLFYSTEADQKIFACAEENYDLLALADFSKVQRFFDAYREYNDIRAKVEERFTYLDTNPDFNEYGDYVVYRENSPCYTSYELNEAFGIHYLTDKAFSRFNHYYGVLLDKGVRIMFSYSPLNESAILEEDKIKSAWSLFDIKMRQNLDTRVKFISDPEDYILPSPYFYDTDYHLSSEGAAYRTELLINDIGIL